MLIFGGGGSKHEKLGDVWQLDLSYKESKSSVWLELVLDAWTAERAKREAAAAAERKSAAEAAAAEAEAAAAAAAASAGKGGKAAPPAKGGAPAEPAVEVEPKQVLDLSKVAKCVGGALGGLPADCFELSRMDEGGDGDGGGGLRVTLKVRPLVGVGLGCIGADGEALPAAAIASLEAVLSTLCPQAGGEEAAADPKGKDAKGKPAPAKGKGGGADDEDLKAARAAASKAAAQSRVLGYPLLEWKAQKQTRLAVVPCVRWSQPAILTTADAAAAEADAAAAGGKGGKGGGKGAPEPTGGAPNPDAPPTPPARSGHSLCRVGEGALLFGGSGGKGLLNDVWLLRLPRASADASADAGAGEGGGQMAWSMPLVTGTPPAPRAFHTAAARPSSAESSLEQLLVCGGATGRPSAASELYVLTLPMFAWSCPRVSGSPPVGRCWHTCASLASTVSPAYRMLVYGGTSATGTVLRDCHMLAPLMAPQAEEPAGGKDAKGKKDDKKGKKGASEPEPEVEEDTRPIEFEWQPMAAAPPPPPEKHTGHAATGLANGSPQKANGLTRPATAGYAPSSAAPTERAQSAPGVPRVGLASGRAGAARRPTVGPAGAVAVSTPELSIAIFAGGGQEGGAAFELLHLYQPSALLSADELAGLAGPPPPSLEIRGLTVTSLSANRMAAAFAADCTVLVRRSDTSDELGRAAVLPFTEAGGRDGRLSCAHASFPLPTDAEYKGEASLSLEVLVGGEAIGSAPLAPLLARRKEGHVAKAALTGGGSLGFDFVRIGPLSAADLAPPPAPPPPSASSARAALDTIKPGAGEMNDEYVGAFRAGLPHGHGVCSYSSGARYEGQWLEGKRHGQGELRDEYGSVYKGGFENGICAGIGAWHYADGSTYSGPMVDGMRHGEGTFRAADGGVYEGQWARGERSGEGTDTSGDGLEWYSGGWLHDKRHGKGKRTTRESAVSLRTTVYEGEWAHGSRHGVGMCAFLNGDVYSGGWQNDYRNGRGVYKAINGEVYDGKWVGDTRRGDGTLRTPTGDVYIGQWHDSVKNGRGKCVYGDGSEYSGQWRDDERHGKGDLIADGGYETYSGSWSLGQRHGNGKHRLGGDVYAGSFHAGSRSGVGKLEFEDGSVYEGEWREGFQEGKGVYASASGERYDGHWSGGERSGHGKCIYSFGDIYEGQWQRGRRAGKGHMTYVSQPPPANPPGFTPRGPPSPLKPQEGKAVLLTQEAFASQGKLPPAPAPAAPAHEPPTYEGDWRDDQRSGVGKSVSFGETYEGDWLHGKRHGRGTCFYPDGEVYVGEWVHGRRQGDGSLANSYPDLSQPSQNG